ncbi:MAG TPA: CoA transferase [Methylomirabilota bacterium]|jgi:crotonobetainyl-CoA:carnitine CoA-transferase CaiB-like acyl-CoA transferase
MADSPRPPLQGVRVLELAHLIAGPICGMYLADMGADVVKVESREAPDAGRSVYPRAVRNGEGVLHLTVNRNKRAICLDVKRPEGRDAFRRLAAWADVVIEGFRGGVAERLGIDYDSVKAVNPRLIYCSISAFGPDGPWREKPGLDSLAQALGGLMAITGEPDGGPVLCGAPVADTLGGMLAIQGVLTALIARAASGQGQRVDASLLNGVLFAHTARLSVFHETGEPLPRYGSGHPEIVPYQAFEAADGWLFVAAWVERLWPPFCKAVGLDALASDPRFATRGDRLTHRRELEAVLAPVFRARPVAEWMEALEKADVLCAPVNDYPALVRHPQVVATGFITEQDHPRAGRFKTIATPVKLEKTPGTIRTPAPGLGEHSEAVLAEAGFSRTEIESLVAKRII